MQAKVKFTKEAWTRIGKSAGWLGKSAEGDGEKGSVFVGETEKMVKAILSNPDFIQRYLLGKPDLATAIYSKLMSDPAFRVRQASDLSDEKELEERSSYKVPEKWVGHESEKSLIKKRFEELLNGSVEMREVEGGLEVLIPEATLESAFGHIHPRGGHIKTIKTPPEMRGGHIKKTVP